MSTSASVQIRLNAVADAKKVVDYLELLVKSNINVPNDVLESARRLYHNV